MVFRKAISALDLQTRVPPRIHAGIINHVQIRVLTLSPWTQQSKKDRLRKSGRLLKRWMAETDDKNAEIAAASLFDPVHSTT